MFVYWAHSLASTVVLKNVGVKNAGAVYKGGKCRSRQSMESCNNKIWHRQTGGEGLAYCKCKATSESTLLVCVFIVELACGVYT